MIICTQKLNKETKIYKNGLIEMTCSTNYTWFKFVYRKLSKSIQSKLRSKSLNFFSF